MARPPDWEARALAWFRSLEGEAPGAVIRAVGGADDPRAHAFARLMVECREQTQAEIDAHAFQTEGKPLFSEIFRALTQK